jgi:hypothetical protein
VKLDQMYPRKYANGSDLKAPATVTIKSVQSEEMRPNPKSPPEKKYVLYALESPRGVILSRTLAEQIAAAVGSDDTDQWTGKQIVLYPVPMQVAGRQVTAIRARKS